MTGSFEEFWTWAKTTPGFASTVFGLLALGLAPLGHAFGLFRWLFGAEPERPTVVVDRHGRLRVRPKSFAALTLTAAANEQRLRQRANEVIAQVGTATGADRERLLSEKFELDWRLAYVGIAHDHARISIVRLGRILARLGNEIGGDTLADAWEALRKSDFSRADDIFAEIESRDETDAQRAAEAAFARGVIAEEQVRWLDAAEHFSRAARAAPDSEAAKRAELFLFRSGRHAEAARWREEDLARTVGKHGERSPQTASASLGLGEIYYAMGRHAEAEKLYRQALEIAEATRSGDPLTCLFAHRHLAEVLLAMGRHAEAETAARQAVEIAKATQGESNWMYPRFLNNLAGVLKTRGRAEEAERLFRQALEKNRRISSDEDPNTRILAGNYARLLREHRPDAPALAALEIVFGDAIGRSPLPGRPAPR